MAKIRVLHNPGYRGLGINLVGREFNAEKNEHGAYGVSVADVQAQGMDLAAFKDESTMWFSSSCVEVLED